MLHETRERESLHTHIPNTNIRRWPHTLTSCWPLAHIEEIATLQKFVVSSIERRRRRQRRRAESKKRARLLRPSPASSGQINAAAAASGLSQSRQRRPRPLGWMAGWLERAELAAPPPAREQHLEAQCPRLVITRRYHCYLHAPQKAVRSPLSIVVPREPAREEREEEEEGARLWSRRAKQASSPPPATTSMNQVVNFIKSGLGLVYGLERM